MKHFVVVVVIVVAVSGWWVFLRGDAERIDLLVQFEQARKDGAPLFAVVDATLAGDTKKAIATPPDSRIRFKVRVPDHGWLKMWIGIEPEAWNRNEDAIYFFVGVNGGGAFEVLFERTLNPFKNRFQRRWIPVAIDLGVYAGDEVEVLMNTRASGAGRVTTPAPRNNLPLWGAPEIVGR